MSSAIHSQSRLSHLPPVVPAQVDSLVAGWGATQNEAPSPTVLTTNLTYLDNGECIRSVRNAFQKLVTHDKFCGKSVENGKA
ncbi:hypothetical protein J6590_072868 [Homalodisca vitripennis]|nr:hypothetical protein J6590_072868 [Homalodisca vitripennis]